MSDGDFLVQHTRTAARDEFAAAARDGLFQQADRQRRADAGVEEGHAFALHVDFVEGVNADLGFRFGDFSGAPRFDEAGEDVLEEADDAVLGDVNTFDDHEVHAIEHKEDLLEHYFEYLGTGDPGMMIIAQSMLAHWNKHSMILREMQVQQAIMTGQIKPAEKSSQSESNG